MGREGVVGANSTALGKWIIASGDYSHAEGTVDADPYEDAATQRTIASGYGSHAENCGVIASGYASHAEGIRSTASGEASHAQGNRTIASGSYADASGVNTTARYRSQHAFGEFNDVDSNGNDLTVRGNFVEIVGNGSSKINRSNARALDWSGNEYLNGDLYINCDGDSSNGTKVLPLPTVTSSNNGSILCVVDGEWTMLPGAFIKTEKTISAEMLSTSLSPGESKTLAFLSTDIPDYMIKSTITLKTASFSNLPSSVVGEVTNIGYSAGNGISYRVKLTNESESAYVNVSSDAAVSLTYSYYSF